jgi:hypothetical protein
MGIIVVISILLSPVFILIYMLANGYIGDPEDG